ncbi:MAG TPA: hypothetical protein VHX17_08945 [Candidatus Cybelea sp.]|jgi:hypothetical protein|nr:hypothetical protein [Candidatus Cybelea sp.]
MRISIAVSAALALALTAPHAGAAQTASMALLRRAVDPNPTLNSYTASAQLSATLHVLIPVHKSFGGTVYYLRPKRKIELQNVPGALSRFKDLATQTPSYEQATAQYTIAPLTDNGTVSTYSAVPKKAGGRVKSITLTITDATALIARAQWTYTNGGTLDFDQTYTTIGQYRLPAKADISARFPGYSVDGTLTFSNYQPNATVSPSVFASPNPS